MFHMDYATIEDIPVWLSFDQHIAERELRSKMNCKRCYLLKYENSVVGVMRYNLFWDSIPFLNLILLDERVHGKGYGRSAMMQWESEMKSLGFSQVMTSTQADETAQGFYRKLGYKDAGCLVLDTQPTELFFVKNL